MRIESLRGHVDGGLEGQEVVVTKVREGGADEAIQKRREPEESDHIITGRCDGMHGGVLKITVFENHDESGQRAPGSLAHQIPSRVIEDIRLHTPEFPAPLAQLATEAVIERAA